MGSHQNGAVERKHRENFLSNHVFTPYGQIHIGGICKLIVMIFFRSNTIFGPFSMTKFSS